MFSLNGLKLCRSLKPSCGQGAVWPLYQLRRQLTNKSTFMEDAVRVSVYTEVFEKSLPKKAPKIAGPCLTMLDLSYRKWYQIVGNVTLAATLGISFGNCELEIVER